MPYQEPLDANVKKEKNTSQENRFETKDGYCYVLEDRLVIGFGKNPSKIKRDKEGENTRRNTILIISFLVFTVMAFLTFLIPANESPTSHYRLPAPVLCAILSLGGLASFVSALRRSFTSIIPRESIDYISIDTNQSTGFLSFLSRQRLEVYYLDKKGRRWKRVLSFQSKISGGNKELSKALSILRRKGLMD